MSGLQGRCLGMPRTMVEKGGVGWVVGEWQFNRRSKAPVLRQRCGQQCVCCARARQVLRKWRWKVSATRLPVSGSHATATVLSVERSVHIGQHAPVK